MVNKRFLKCIHLLLCHTTKQILSISIWQNMEVLRKMGKYTGITLKCVVPISKQLLISAQVVIGTLGTIKKWMSNRKLGATKIKILVFDEADHTLAEVDFILVVIFIFGEIRSIIIIFKKLHYLILFVSRSLVCLGRQI
jgi:superfamily II DNA/RNA helicase